jgi:putative flippase GtrA
VLAATGSFLVAATNNYVLNRAWTFRQERGHVAYQGLRFLVVSALAYAANLALLALLVEAAGLGKFVAQAIAIMLVVPVNFVGNKLWSFRRR